MSTGARFGLGLVVGKFAPLHAGHLHLIDSATARCNHLLILSWCAPEPARCDAESRRRWLAECCPAHEALVFDDAALAAACQARGIAARCLPPDTAADGVQQQFLAWLLRDLLGRRPDAMFASEPYLQPCAALLGRELGQQVQAIAVDPARVQVPISATRIRRDPQAERAFVPPAVWADWAPRVCVLGGESSGKTTLVAALAAHHRAQSVAEYGRERWEQCGGQLDEPDLLHIAQVQVARERAAARDAPGPVFCDTSALTTLFYSLNLFGRADPSLRRLADRSYDLHVLCEPDFPFVQDGTRRAPGFREHQHAWYVRELTERGVPVLTVRGPVAARVAQVGAALAAHAN